ncbi:efflux RND transporter periplasmic adaptor subunit [Edaphobacter modestus]|uniref:RND family efflux transporter MFP subunit n=1 Tax=Edaphobacter modestus TaxID=388466 RepID=A0A4Q7YZS1_9BACT|nr:efflux RND transporter periplasmic adaptor subunit [Edaphobacter modestus]RZU43437.1 RND family efflux transporter MFP subunit [Edaphobacter modestus]
MSNSRGTHTLENGMPSTQEAVKPAQTDIVPAHKEDHTNGTVEGPGSGRTVGILFAVALIAAISYGLHLRSSHEKEVTRATDEAAILSVNVVQPHSGSGAAQDLVLPGNVQAFTQAPIYSRTNGYLKKWYFDIGAHVRQGQLLAEIETPEVDQQLQQSRAELDRMQANMELAGVTSNRWQSLLAKHAVSQQETDQARSNYIAAQAAVDASKANVRRLEQLQNYEKIVAPFDGVITARNTDIGDLIDAGSSSSNPRALFQLATTGKLRVYAAVPEVYADSIHNGDTADLTQDSNPSEKIPGTIVRNAKAIDLASRTLNVEVDVNNRDNRLLPGAYVFVHFHVPGGANAFTVPSNTLLFRAEGLRVAVVRNDRVELAPVTIGQDYGNTVEITSGLTSSDEIVIDPSDSLASGMQVRANRGAKGRS